MKNSIEIRARRTGKTTDLLKNFFEDQNNAYFLVHKAQMKDYILRSIQNNFLVDVNEVKDKIITLRDILNKKSFRSHDSILMGFGTRTFRKYQKSKITLYIDEILCFTQPEVKEILKLKDEIDLTIIGIGTAQTLYNKSLIELTRFIKKQDKPLEMLDLLKREVKHEILEDYMYNFLTEPDFRIISPNVNLVHNLNKNQILTEALGLWYEIKF